jgi:hypothetical protein
MTTASPEENNSLSPATRQALVKAEAEFLQQGAKLTSQIVALQTKLTQQVVDAELVDTFGMSSVYELDTVHNNGTTSSGTATNNETVGTNNHNALVPVASPKKDKATGVHNQQLQQQLQRELSKLQMELQTLELDFIKTVVQAVGPQYGAAIRSTLLGDVAVRGTGGLLQSLQDRPLRTLLGSGRDSQEVPGNVFVTRFPGDGTRYGVVVVVFVRVERTLFSL